MDSRRVFTKNAARWPLRGYGWERRQGDYDWNEPTSLREGAALVGILFVAFMVLCVADEAIGHGSGGKTASIPPSVTGARNL